MQIVRVMSEQYESFTAPKSTFTRSRSRSFRPVTGACGIAAFGPDAAMVSKANLSAPSSRIARSTSPASAPSVIPAFVRLSARTQALSAMPTARLMAAISFGVFTIRSPATSPRVAAIRRPAVCPRSSRV